MNPLETNISLIYSEAKTFDLSASKVFSSASVSSKNIEASSNSKPNLLGIEYEEDIPKRSPNDEPFTITYNQWESLEIIKKRVGEHLSYDVEPFHYVTNHGSIQPNSLLKDYQIQNNSVILMIPKNQFEKERIRRRDIWINMKKNAKKPKPVITSLIKKPVKKKTKRPFYL